MLHRLARGLLPAVLLISAAIAGAADSAGPPHPAKAEPLDARAAVPPAVHRSVLERYRPQRELTLRSWKEANDEVARIGGWRVYAREAASPETEAVGKEAR